MKIIIRCLSCILIIMIFPDFGTTPALAQNHVRSIDVQAVLHEDGSMHESSGEEVSALGLFNGNALYWVPFGTYLVAQQVKKEKAAKKLQKFAQNGLQIIAKQRACRQRL